MGTSLAMGSDNDRMPVIEMIEIVLESGSHVLVCKVERLHRLQSIICKIGLEIRLPVPGCIHIGLVEDTRLEENSGIICLRIQIGLVDICIPSFIFYIRKCGWMNKKNINC